MRYFLLALSVCLFSGSLSTVQAATLPTAPPYVATILFDLRITRDSVLDFETGQVVSETRGGGYTDRSFILRSEDMDHVSLGANSVSMEWGGWTVKSFRYDFGTRRGVLDLGDGINLVERYTFDGGSGSYWYETDGYPLFDSVQGTLRRVQVYLTAPGDPLPVSPVPLPAPLPLVAAGFAALALLRRGGLRRDVPTAAARSPA